MPTMRHPNGAGPYEALEEQVPMMRRTGWLTREEWEQREDLPAWEPEPEPDDQEDSGRKDGPDEEPGEEKTKPTRSKPRAASKKESD